MLKKLRKIWKKVIVLLVLGIAVSLLLLRAKDSPVDAFVSDVLFVCAIVFFLSGMTEIVSNIGLFNGLVFGGKCLYRLFRQKLGYSSEVKEEYLEYVRTRVKFNDVLLLLLISAVLGAASVVIYSVMQGINLTH